MADDDVGKTLYVSNLSHRVTDELIYELFLQAGPIEQCSIQKSKYGVVQYKHAESVPFAKNIFNGTVLNGRELKISEINPEMDEKKHYHRQYNQYHDHYRHRDDYSHHQRSRNDYGDRRGNRYH